MNDDASVPYYLTPKRTKLPAGHDDTLDPPVPPTDAETRGLPPTDWPAVDLSRGPDGPADAPLAPPATDPFRRTVPASSWPRSAREFVPGRSVHLAVPVPDLDPDIAMWRTVEVSIWPFTGAPSEGVWPKGWLGVDNTATLYVCTAGGEPGTWAKVGTGVASGWPSVNGNGPGNLVAVTPNTDHTGYSFHDQGSGGFSVVTDSAEVSFISGAGINIQDNDTTIGVGISSNGPMSVQTNIANTHPLQLLALGSGGIDIDPGPGGMVSVLSAHAGHLGAPYTMTGAFVTFLSTASLAVGTWLVNFNATIEVAAATAAEIATTQGTATALLEGVISGEVSNSDASNGGAYTIGLSFIATVSVAGALAFQAKGGTANVVDNLTPTSFAANATGYTAVRIA